MPVEITMPQLSDTMSEGKILTWLKNEGDKVSRGDALAEVATDKADLEIESFHDGVLLKVLSPIGTTVKVGSIIALVGEAGESVAQTSAGQNTASAGALAKNSSKPTEKSAVPPSKDQTATEQSSPNNIVQFHKNDKAPLAEASTSSDAEERVKISPLAKNIAKSHGIDYSQLNGTGEGGRIVKKDIESKLETGTAQSSTAANQTTANQSSKYPSDKPHSERHIPSISVVPLVGGENNSKVALSKMRQTIANRMVESATTIPHFYVTAKMDVSELVKIRTTLKALPQYEGVTYNHLIIKAVAICLEKFPRINSNFQDYQLIQPADINIGVITALPDGLLIPVLKCANTLPLIDIVSETKALVQRARSGRPKADDLQGATFCISNIGLAPVENFTAIINPGNGAILAVSSIQDEPVIKEEKIVPGKIMRVTLSSDHRIIDGVVAGEFITELKKVLEEPILLLA